MSIVFDGKLIRKVRFTDAFREELNEMLTEGSLIVFSGPPIAAVSAASTLLAGVKAKSKYHDADGVVLGSIGWNNEDRGMFDSFRFSMTAFQLVGLGYLSSGLITECRKDKNVKFYLWLTSTIQSRARRGFVTVVAAEDTAMQPLAKFFGKDLVSQYGRIAKTSKVLEDWDVEEHEEEEAVVSKQDLKRQKQLEDRGLKLKGTGSGGRTGD